MKGCSPLTDAEIADILTSFGGQYAARDRALFILGTKSGFRISELLSLQIGDVIQSGKMVDRVTVRRARMKKKIEGRTVLLHPDAKTALSEWLEKLRVMGYMAVGDYVFQSRKGGNQPISKVQAWRIIRGVAAAAGVNGKVGTHSMRKTFANAVYEKLDRDLVRTQRALGHRNVNSTVSYLSFREEDIDQAILAL